MADIFDADMERRVEEALAKMPKPKPEGREARRRKAALAAIISVM